MRIAVWKAIEGAVLAFAALMAASSANAQTAFTTSATERIILNPISVTNRNTVNSTQVIGLLLGGTPLYDQTFAAAFNDPMVQSGLQAARMAITAAGGPGVIIGTPVLTASSHVTSSSSVTTYSLNTSIAPIVTVGAGVTYIGPTTYLTGDLTSCAAALAGLPSSTPPTCQTLQSAGSVILVCGCQRVLPGATYTAVIQAGAVGIDVRTDTAYTVDQTSVTTETTTNFEQYTLTGVVRRIGTVHALAPGAAGDAGDQFLRRLREIDEGADESRRARLWLQGYAWRGDRDVQGEIPADRRTGEGVEGGVTFGLGGLRGGLGADWGKTRLRLGAVGESASVELLQIGARLAWRGGGWVARASAAAGWGRIDTATDAPDIGFTTAARNDISTLGASAELGRAFAIRDWVLTGSLGGRVRRVSADGFTEPGLYGLTGAASAWTNLRGWLGLALANSDASPVHAKGYARLTVDDNDRYVLPVSFTQLAAPLTLAGADLGHVGGEAGAELLLAIAPNAAIYLNYEARLRRDLVLHSGAVGIRIAL